MTRRGRSAVSVLLAVLALAAILPAPCACLPEAAPTDPHGCCAGALVLSAPAPGCCPAAEPGKGAQAAHPEAPAVLPALAFAPSSTVAAPAALVVLAVAREPFASPPSTVRRL
jgi:hypothetical protein